MTASRSIKYSPQAEQVVVRLARNERDAIVSVQDEGIGIDEKYHEKIFERYYQVTDPLAKTFPGLGLGLYISREIIKRHHGRMWVESQAGAGSTFFFSLPLGKN